MLLLIYVFLRQKTSIDKNGFLLFIDNENTQYRENCIATKYMHSVSQDFEKKHSREKKFITDIHKSTLITFAPLW